MNLNVKYDNGSLIAPVTCVRPTCNMSASFIFLLLLHCVKSVLIRSFWRPYFLAFGLNTERIRRDRIRSKCRKIRSRKTLNMDTCHAVLVFDPFRHNFPFSLHLFCVLVDYLEASVFIYLFSWMIFVLDVGV